MTIHSVQWYDDWWVMNRKGCGRKLSCCFMRQKTQHAVSGVTTDTRTIRLPIKSLERYRYADRLVWRCTVWHGTMFCSEMATRVYQTSRRNMFIRPAAVSCLHVNTADTVLAAAVCNATGLSTRATPKWWERPACVGQPTRGCPSSQGPVGCRNLTAGKLSCYEVWFMYQCFI